LSLWRLGFNDGRHWDAGRGICLSSCGHAGGACADWGVELRTHPVVGSPRNLRLHEDLVLKEILLDIAGVWRHLTLQQVHPSWQHMCGFKVGLATGGLPLDDLEVSRALHVLCPLELGRHLVGYTDILDGSAIATDFLRRYFPRSGTYSQPHRTDLIFIRHTLPNL